MIPDVVVADWIKRIADDERQRDAVRTREEEAVARKARLVRANGQRLIDELQAAIVRDVNTFEGEFSSEGRRGIVFEPAKSSTGFVVSKPTSPAVALTVQPNIEGATIKCRYRFTTANGMPPREQNLDLVFAGDGEDKLQIKNHGTGQLFRTSDALSEFLLGPVFTGRPR